MQTEFIVQGRIVWGHPGNPIKKVDPVTKQPKLNKNGIQPDVYSFGLAVDKNQFNASVLPYMQQVALSTFPSGVPADFAWKYKDGDTATDKKGKPYNQMEGRAGHMIMTISTEAFQPPLYKWNEATKSYDGISPEEIKCGYYVAVKVICKFNGSNGVYLNPDGIVLVGYGNEIASSSSDPDAKFAGFTPSLPVGATATPQMNTTAGPIPGQAPVAPAMPQAAPVAPAMPQPAYGFVDNAGTPQQNQPATPTTQPAMAGLPQGR